MKRGKTRNTSQIHLPDPMKELEDHKNRVLGWTKNPMFRAMWAEAGGSLEGLDEAREEMQKKFK